MAVNIGEITEILTKAGLPPTESVTIPAKVAQFGAAPSRLAPALADVLHEHLPNGLYSHQAMAIEALVGGADVCISTQTASGKSLIFMAAAAEIILARPANRVLALYPAKALIQDQLEKWRSFLAPFNATVAFIDGSVPVASRPEILRKNQVIAMTPDVAHAWLMSHTGTAECARFLADLRLLVLDEAHVYDGAFGTNMAYFLRRLTLAASQFRIVCSTATVGEPKEFMRQLTGRDMLIVDSSHDTSAVAEKTLLLCPSSRKGGFDKTVQLLGGLADYGKARFLAFGDSRKAVERIVGAILRRQSKTEDEADGNEDADPPEDLSTWPPLENVLPYRAGYENEDRSTIQRSITNGSLAGVVSTSALELGLDIGDLDVVVLLNTPDTIKSFRQRIGRAGRRREAVCILIDEDGQMSPLPQYAEREPEPSWLYLENRYIQYANALCAAVELQARGVKTTSGLNFPWLPDAFARLVENELNPTEAIEEELYDLKQRAQGNPHYEFPIRSAAEPNFDVEGPRGLKLGNLSYGQALREAYPGAIYYYMARPFRILALDYKKGRIRAQYARHFTTRPISDTMAFPDFKNGIVTAWKSSEGFLAEVELQVSERIKGFTEQRGQTKTAYEYGPTSHYSQRPLLRSFRTTGVCWAFPTQLDRSEKLADLMLQAFAYTCGIQERDLGIALFHANEGPFSIEQAKGMVIFDATNGSLRLTERLGRQFAEVVAAALAQAQPGSDEERDLLALRGAASALEPAAAQPQAERIVSDGDTIAVIDRNQQALYNSADGPLEVTVLDFRYTPNGLMYQLEPIKPAGKAIVFENGKHHAERKVVERAPGKWMVLASAVMPLVGSTNMVRYNVITGEETPDTSVGQ